MRERIKAAKRSLQGGQSRWWRISEQEWYKLVMAALTLVATTLAAFFALRQAWPDPQSVKSVKNNYAILLDRSATMGGQFGGTTKLDAAVGKILGTIDTVDSETTARGLWYFGGGCGVVDEQVGIRPDNASQLSDALHDAPSPRGERSLYKALDVVVSSLAEVPVTVGEGDVKTVRQIIVYTDGIDECDGDLSPVTTSLNESGIDIGFWMIGMDLAPAEKERLDEVAQSLPGVGDGPAQLVVVHNEKELEDATTAATTTSETTEDTSTTSTTTDLTTTTTDLTTTTTDLTTTTMESPTTSIPSSDTTDNVEVSTTE